MTEVIGRQGSYAKGVARRIEILDRAIEVFADRGASGASLRRIAESLGVSHAALLHYFDSREQLLVAVYERAESRRLADPDANPDAVDLIVRAAMDNAQVPGLVELYTTLLAASIEAGDSISRQYFTDRFERVRIALTERLARDQRDGRMRSDVDAADVAALIVAASDGLQVQWLLDPSIQLDRTLQTFAKLMQVEDGRRGERA